MPSSSLKTRRKSSLSVLYLLTIEKNELNDNLTKIKGELSVAYESLREVDGSKATILGTLRSLERDIGEIDEKMKKDEDRKVKIQK